MSYEPAPLICPVDLKRSVPVRIVEDTDAPNPQPGDLMPLTDSGGRLRGYAFRCVGCGVETFLPLAPRESSPCWNVTAGDPQTGAGLTLTPSIHHPIPADRARGCGCGWHGWLNAGVFTPV